MGGIFNSSEEIAKMAEYPNIRLFRINHATASEPQDDFNGNFEFSCHFEKSDSTNSSDVYYFNFT